MITLYHRGGPAPCYRPAMALRQRQSSRHELPADNVVKLGGVAPVRGEAVMCGTCGEPVVAQWLFESPVCEVTVA